MARKRITEVEKEIMKDIAHNLQSIIKRKGISQRELSELSGFSTSAISDYINAKTLMAMSTLQHLAQVLNVQASDIQSSLATVDTGGYSVKKIPLLGEICAGNGLLAADNIEDYIVFPYPNKKQPDFALLVKGDSMKNAGIENGDIVFFNQTNQPDFNGQIVAVVANDEGMLKKIKWSSDKPEFILSPENDDFKELTVPFSEVHICGTYMGHIRPFNL